MKRIQASHLVGQAILEFVLFATLLLLLIAGIVDVGRALFVYITLSDAAQEGAAYAAVAPTDLSGICQRVLANTQQVAGVSRALLEQHNTLACNSPVTSVACGATSGEQLVIRVCHEGALTPGESLRVEVAASFTLVFPFGNVLFPENQVTLTAWAVQTVLTP